MSKLKFYLSSVQSKVEQTNVMRNRLNQLEQNIKPKNTNYLSDINNKQEYVSPFPVMSKLLKELFEKAINKVKN